MYPFRPTRKTAAPSSKHRGLGPTSLQLEYLEDRRLLATTLQVLAAGSSHTEQMALEVQGVEVQRWTNIGGNFDLREYATHTYTHPTNVTADDVVVRLVNSSGANKDLRVDGIRVNGLKYESESNTTWATGTWDNNLQAIAPAFAQSEIIHANEGTFEYSAVSGSSVEIRAAGKTNTETMRLWVDNQLVKTWNNIGGNYDLNDFWTYSYAHPSKVSAGDIRVEFSNDGTTTGGGDRNLKVDALTIDGRRIETESSTTFSTGTWQNGSVTPSFPQNESLHANGYFQFSEMPEGGSNVIVYAAGKTGEETVDLRTNGKVVASFESVAGNYFGRQFVPYGFAHPRSLSLDSIEVGFSNDATTAAGDRNARVDAIVHDGLRHEVEAPTTLSTGTWQPLVGVQTGFWQSEILHADGVFRFDQDLSQTGTLAIGSTQYAVQENSPGYVDVEFIRTGGTLGALTLDYTTLNGTAIAGQDFTATSGTAVFNDGQSSTTVRINITNDSLSEGTETFNVAADRVTGGAFLGQPRTTTITINDDEAPGPGNGNGLRGDYFQGKALTDLLTSRTDDTVNFNWGNGSPHARVPSDDFSVRWSGEVLPLHSETYTFQTRTDDGVRLWVNDSLIIDKWIDQSPTVHQGQISLQGGTKYDIRMEFYERGGGAVADLSWFSASQSLEIIPESQLFSQEVTPDEGQFVAETIVTGLTQPTAIDFTSAGGNELMYISQKDGRVRLAINGVLQGTDFLDYRTPVNNTRDRGLLGLAVHPNFVANPYVYILYTYDPPETQGSGGLGAPDNFGNRGSRLTRVTADASNGYRTIVAGSEVVLLGTNSTWDNISDPFKDSTNDMNLPASGLLPNGDFIDDILITDSQSHTIGALAFAPDGSLYVSNGDGASYGRVDPRATRVQRLDSLSGKVLRINPLTGQGYTNNPFSTGNVNDDQSKVFNYGLRNPFRMAVNPADGLPYVGDVGWTSWEEINGGRGKNFGWPYYEGGNGQNLQTGGYRDLPEAQAFYASNPNATAPVQSRSHGAGGVAVVMGDFYTGTLYPEIYQGTAFYTDFGEPTIRALALDSSGNFQHTLVVTGSVGTVVEMTMGPDGRMYYVDMVAGRVGRLDYVATASTASSSAAFAFTKPSSISAVSSPSVLATAPIRATDEALELLLIEDPGALNETSIAFESFDESSESEAHPAWAEESDEGLVLAF